MLCSLAEVSFQKSRLDGLMGPYPHPPTPATPPADCYLKQVVDPLLQNLPSIRVTESSLALHSWNPITAAHPAHTEFSSVPQINHMWLYPALSRALFFTARIAAAFPFPPAPCTSPSPGSFLYAGQTCPASLCRSRAQLLPASPGDAVSAAVSFSIILPGSNMSQGGKDRVFNPLCPQSRGQKYSRNPRSWIK